MICDQAALGAVRCNIVEDEVGVGSAKAEAVDAGAAEAFDWPGSEFGGDLRGQKRVSLVQIM